MERGGIANEEGMIAKAIEEETAWDFLSKRLRAFLGSSEEWNKRVKDHYMKKRLRWSEFLGRLGCRELEYYEDLMRYLRKNQSLFPYHLSEIICRNMRIAPFRYYCDLLYEVMKHERSYDTIPNFSAADALRLTGIGRNEFIDIMNKCRAKKLMWKINKSIVKEHLPNAPVDVNIDSWWNVCVVNILNEEYRKLSEDEMVVLEKVVKEGASLVGELDLDMVRKLYRRGLVYFDVPVYSGDRFQVSTLEGFVSNRDQSYEDPTEELLYQVFVASSEHSTVAELAGTLQADLLQLEAAVSLACRLGYAKKIFDPSNFLGKDAGIPGSPNSGDSAGDDGGHGLMGFPGGLHDDMMDGSSPDHMGHAFGSYGDLSGMGRNLMRFALMVDANLTSYLMMGSLSPGLKRHAVTLFEAGKLGDVSVTEIIEELQGVEGQKLEGELQRFADHAISLRHVLQCLQQGGQLWEPTGMETVEQREVGELGERFSGLLVGEGSDSETVASGGGVLSAKEEDTAGESSGNGGEVDGVRGGRMLGQGEAGVDEENWQGWQVAASKSGRGVPGPPSQGEWKEEIELRDVDEEGGSLSVMKQSGDAVGVKENDSASQRDEGDYGSGGSPSMGVVMGRESGEDIDSQWKGGASGFGMSRLRYPVEMLRCESLAGLPPATLQRVMKRDYAVVVSMVPLLSAPPMVSSEGMGPVHFGPPSAAAVSPWMKLLVYAVGGSGPVTVALVQGQRLRELPAAMLNCAKALVWSWDGETLGGVGGKGDGTLVNGSLLLHVLNALLRQSAVLVQPLWNEDGSDNSKPETVDLPLPILDELLCIDDETLDTDGGGPPPLAGRKTPVGVRGSSKFGGEGGQREEVVALHKVPAVTRVVQELELGTVGYIRMMKVWRPPGKETSMVSSSGRRGTSEWVPQSVEFGVPLFQTELCKSVCDGAMKARLFEPAALERHRIAMLNLRLKLGEFISDYKAGGPIAMAAYLGVPHLEWGNLSSFGGGRGRLGSLDDISIISGAPSPIASPRFVSGEQRGVSGEQRAHRRMRSEVASFDSSDPSFSPFPLASSQDSLKNLWRGTGGGSTPPRVFQAPHRIVEETPRSETAPSGAPAPASSAANVRVEEEEDEFVLPGVNLLFDGRRLQPLDVSMCLQGRLPALLVAEVAVASGLVSFDGMENTASSSRRGSLSVSSSFSQLS